MSENLSTNKNAAAADHVRGRRIEGYELLDGECDKRADERGRMWIAKGREERVGNEQRPVTQ